MPNSPQEINALPSPDGVEGSRRVEAASAALGSEAEPPPSPANSDFLIQLKEPAPDVIAEAESNANTSLSVEGQTGKPAQDVILPQQPLSSTLQADTNVSPENIQQQVKDAVEVRVKKWREARQKERPWAVISVAEEFEMRRHLTESEAAERGIARPPVAPPPVQTIKVFLDRPFPPKEDLITGLLHRRDMVALLGRRRHGKTTFMSNLAVSVTLTHSHFLGYPIPKPLRVLALYLEDDAAEVQIRLRRMCKGELLGERLALYTREDFLRAKVPINGTNLHFQKLLTEVCAAHRPDVIILDNLAHLVSADYNNSKLVHELAQFLFQLTLDFNSAVIIAAHPRKRDKKGKGTSSLRDDPEGFFEEAMGSSHFVNSCGSLWGIERDQNSDRTVFLGGTQRFTGQQSLMTLIKDDDDWLQVLDNLEVNLPLALNTPARKKAWELLADEPFSYTEGERAVKPAMKSNSTFHAWFQQCQRLGLLICDGDHYRKAAGTQSGIVEVSS